ncbi:MAG: hypothetical protein P8009_09145 [Gammaproteobacteria bacterium]
MAALTVPFAVPTAEQVGIPAYPGAKIEKIEGRSMENWGQYSGLPDLILLTTDSVEQVHAFYAKHLSSWHTKKMHRGYIIEWHTKKMHRGYIIEHATIALGKDKVQPRVEIHFVADMLGKAGYEKDMPGAKTVIIVRYLPPEVENAKDPVKVNFPPKAESSK